MPHIIGLLVADGDGFVTASRSHLTLTLEGIKGDRHAGRDRAADVRTPWHARGARIANTRQLSIVSVEECAEIAALLGVSEVDPALLGANVVVAGLPQLSLMDPASRLLLPSGATIFITEQNAPCRHPAEKLARAHGMPQLVASFARAAIGRRGLVALVEREGAIKVGDAVRHLSSPARVSSPKLHVELSNAALLPRPSGPIRRTSAVGSPKDKKTGLEIDPAGPKSRADLSPRPLLSEGNTDAMTDPTQGD